MDNLVKLEKIVGPMLNVDLESWMAQLPLPLKSLPIISLAIPGSHDSLTYTIQRFNDVGPDKSRILQFCGRYFGLVTKPIIFNWAITQDCSITSQLNGGIRYFDLRLAAKTHTEDIFFVHGLYGCAVDQPLSEINEWLSEHPREVVILDLQHFYSFDDSHHRKFVAKLKTIFHGKICPSYRRIEQITLNWLNQEKYQIFLVYRNIVIANEPNFWPGGFWPTPWPNTVNKAKLVEFLDRALSQRSRNRAFVSQCILTPDTNFVLRHIFGNLRDLICQETTLAWVQKHKPGTGGMNVVISDYVSRDEFVFSKTVIQRNFTLL